MKFRALGLVPLLLVIALLARDAGFVESAPERKAIVLGDAKRDVRARPALPVDRQRAATLDVRHDGMTLSADDPGSEKALVEGGAAIRVGALDGDVIEPWHARGR